jgi:phosphoribosylanthranilate isomerase|tara:strand:+ start:1372 stop:2025 length:654 start_codon:yes stop_codon:yes gene_type:complete
VSSSTKIKICGLRSAEAAIVASDAGADFLGFNFVEGVRRQIQLADATQILTDYREGRNTPNRPGLVGLFRDQDVYEVNETARTLALDYLQLCGDEDDEYISKVELPVFKQLFVKQGITSSDVSAMVSPFLSSGHGIVLDSFTKGALGGSGKSFDWASAEGVANREKVFLAGGLNPENVHSAIEQLAPWGVDVASGVETDGVKDPARIRAFIEAARNA